MKRILCTLLALLLLSGVSLADETPPLSDGEYDYRLVEGGAELLWVQFGDSLPATIVLPETLGGVPLVGIGSNAFNTSEYGYDECIQYIVLPESVKYLAEAAFLCCHHGAVVVFPSTLEVIPEGVSSHFSGEILLNNANPYFTNDHGFLVDTRTSTLLYASPSADYCELPAVRRLGGGCLQNWRSPEDGVYIPECVEEIGEAALYDSYYPRIVLPESLRSIGDMGLYCAVLEETVIPAGCTDIGEEALPFVVDEPWW